MILKNHASRWKFGWGAAVLILGLGTAGQLRGDSGDLARPEVGPEVGGGGIDPVGEDGIRPSEARLRESGADGSPVVQISDQQSGSDKGDNSFAKLLTVIEEKSFHQDEKAEEDVLQQHQETEVGMGDSVIAVTVGDHLGSHSSKDVDSASPLVEDPIFTLADGMDKLKDVSRRLRADRSVKDMNSASLLVDLKEMAQAFFRSLLRVQDHYERGDKEGAAASLKSAVGDVEYLAKASRGEAKRRNNGLDILESSSLDDATFYGLDKVSNAELAEFLQPQFFEEQIGIVQNVVDILENFDLSLLSSQLDEATAQKDFESDLDLATVKNDAREMPMFGSNDFDFGFAGGQKKFGQSHGHYRPQNFFDHSPLPNVFHQQNTAAVNQRLNKMSSLFQYDEVLARHELRMNALGDACPSECNSTDVQCNCEKLFNCVKEMSTYDLAVMTAGGFIDKTPTSENYANFTIYVDDLSLFDADGELAEKFERIQDKANAVDDTSNSNCIAVLEELYTGCDPSKVSCSNPNTESFQVSIVQVCSAVKTKTKLLFETIGDEFDGFVDQGVVAKEKPLSFDVCREFVAAFDSLYENRDQNIYDLPNPMRKSTQALHDKTTLQIFQHAQFPVRNRFNKNQQTGIVNRTFTGVTGDRYFTIVLKASDKIPIAMTQTPKVISYDARCGEKVLMKTHNPSDALQHFKLSNDEKSLVPKNCLGHRLTLVGSSNNVCFEGARLRLMPASASSSAYDKVFRVRYDGSIVSGKCPNLEMTAIEDGTLLETVENPYIMSLIAVSFVNPASQKVFSTRRVWCEGDDPLSIRLNDYDAASQSQYFHIIKTSFKTESGKSLFRIVSAAECGSNRGAITNGGVIEAEGRSLDQKCAAGQIIRIADVHSQEVDIMDKPHHQLWTINSKGYVELDSGSGCSKKVIGFQNNEATTFLRLQNKTNDNRFFDIVVPNQHFIPVSNEITFLPAAGNLKQLWEFYSVDPPYDFAVLPEFPGDLNGGALSSASDRDLSKCAMRMCDQSMNLLLGSQMSLGTLRAIDSDMKVNGPERMPGKCCFDTPTTNQDYLGLEFDPAVMNCTKPGLWHLGISKEACNNAGGKWHRSPCITLKSCIDARPARFDLASSQDGTCQDNSGRLNIGFVWSDSQHVNYTFDGTASGCSDFCRSLPEDSHQVGMMTVNDGENNGDKCICVYNDAKVPNQVPEYAARSPPKFSLISNGKALGLSHEITDCTEDEINIEVQAFENSPRQQLHLSSEGQLVSAKCPQRVFTAFENGNLKAMASHHLSDVDIRQQQWVYSADSESISNVMYPELLISSINSDVSTLDSYYFYIMNQRTGLVLAVDGDACADGLRLVLQTETAGSSNQMFKLGDVDQIISMKCPSYAIAIPLCVTDIALQLQALDPASALKNRWQFGNDGKIESLDCRGMFIGTGSTSSRDGIDVVTSAQRGAGSGNAAYTTPRVRTEPMSVTPGFDNNAATDTVPRDRAAYNERQVPRVGAEIVLLSSGMKQQFLTWTLRRQRFTDLIGPYFFVNELVRRNGVSVDGSWVHPNRAVRCNYFKFNKSEWDAYFGGFTGENDLNVIQCRGDAAIWTGQITVRVHKSYRGEDLPPFGRRNDGTQACGQWEADDYVVNPGEPCVNSGNKFAMGIEDGECMNEMNLNAQDYDQNSPNQLFYLGNHGSIYSAKCRGGAISMVGSCSEQNLLKLHSFENDNSMKWEYMSNGALRSAKCQKSPENTHCNNLRTRKVRIDWLGVPVPCRPDRFISLREVQVFDFNGINVALNMPVEMRPSGSVHQSEVSVDGVDSTHIHIVDAECEHDMHWEIDLGVDVLVKEVVVTPFNLSHLYNSKVTLLDNNGGIVETYHLYDLPETTFALEKIEPPAIIGQDTSEGSVASTTSTEQNYTLKAKQMGNKSGGESCGADVECMSGNCASIIDNTKLCSIQPSTIALPIGSLCRHDFQCEGSAECYDGTTCRLVISIIDDSSSKAVSITDCDGEGTNLVLLQNFARENTAQQFYLESDGYISSVKCPGKSLALQNRSCEEGGAIVPLTSAEMRRRDRGAGPKDHFKWIFHHDGSIESAHCDEGKYWGVDWGAYEVISIINDENKAITSNCNNGNPLRAFREYNEDDADQQFLLRFDGRISPVKCPNKDLAIDDTSCLGDVTLTSSDASHFKWKFNQQDGSIESANCRGSYLRIGNNRERLKLGGADSPGVRGWRVNKFQHSYNLLSKSMKMTWSVYHQPRGKFNLSCHDYVASVDEDANTAPAEIRLTLPGINQQESKKWNRENTRLLSAQSGGSLWNQKWKINFVGDYDRSGVVGELLGPKVGSVVKCYEPNLAFSPSFEEFAKDSAIANAADEAQCQHARAQLAFDADFPFDADVCDAFNKKMCGLEFLTNHAQVDYALESLSSPPKFEKGEYEEVKYDRVEYTEDVFAAPKYDEDPDLQLDPINTKEEEWDAAEDEESTAGESPSPSKNSLNQLQDAWLAFQLVQNVAERAEMFAAMEKCDVLPDPLPGPMTCLPNPARYICELAHLIYRSIILSLLVVAQLGTEILFIAFEKQTEGPDGEVYANNASRKTYWNLKNLDTYLKDALQKTNDNMQKQHTSMRGQLQTRHLELETHIRQDIFDSGNDIGRAIITAQNALGGEIVDSRNSNAQAIVDARNANSDLHNTLSAWLHENLCRIYEANGGTCTDFIGPLPEDQTFTPMVLSWSEGQPNMMDRLEHLEEMGTGIRDAVVDIEKTLTVGMSKDEGEAMDGVETVNAESSVEGKVDAVEAKLDAMQGQMDAMQGQMDAMQGQMDEMINAVENKMDDMTELISRVMQQNMKVMEALA